jgi:CBS-domain-containing membrane protein
MLDCCKIITRKGITALAIVSPKTGKLIGSVRSGDLSNIESWISSDMLQQTVAHFVAKHQTAQSVTVSLPAQDSFKQLLLTLSEHRSRQVFVVNGAGKPVGIVTQVDVLALLYNHFKTIGA